MRQNMNGEITLSQREYVALVAAGEVSEDEIREFITSYEDWLSSIENIGGSFEETNTIEAQPNR